MPRLKDSLYDAQQIQIPPAFPDILKQYTKAAIRTQPRDLLQWSAAYFRALADGEHPPVKDRLEYPPPATSTGLTPGLLKVLHKQLGEKEVVALADVEGKWIGVCLDKSQLDRVVQLGGFHDECEWLKLFALAAGELTSTLTDTMKVICELLTHDLDGGAASIPYDLFAKLYTFLVEVNKEIPSGQVKEVLQYLKDMASLQDNKVMPRNFLSPECPRLE